MHLLIVQREVLVTYYHVQFDTDLKQNTTEVSISHWIQVVLRRLNMNQEVQFWGVDAKTLHDFAKVDLAQRYRLCNMYQTGQEKINQVKTWDRKLSSVQTEWMCVCKHGITSCWSTTKLDTAAHRYSRQIDRNRACHYSTLYFTTAATTKTPSLSPISMFISHSPRGETISTLSSVWGWYTCAWAQTHKHKHTRDQRQVDPN